MTNTNGAFRTKLVSLDDLEGLSLEAGRMALRRGQGSERQRERLCRFYETFDAAIERGESRSAAIAAAKEHAGLP